MKSQFRRAMFILVVLVILAAIHLFIYTQNITLKYKSTEEKIALNKIVSENRQLGSEVAQKENLAYVEKVATEKLGMVYPDKVNYILKATEARD